jgi:hypothetical protein
MADKQLVRMFIYTETDGNGWTKLHIRPTLPYGMPETVPHSEYATNIRIELPKGVELTVERH